MSRMWGSTRGPVHIPDGLSIHASWCLAPSLLLRKRHLWSFSQALFATLLHREPSCSLLTVHGKQEGKHRDHTNFAYLLSFKKLSKLPLCGSSAIIIQQWQQNLFKITPLAVQVSSDHGIMESWKTKAQFTLQSFTFMFEKNSFRGL